MNTDYQMLRPISTLALLTLSLSIVPPTAARADEPAAIAPYLTDDVSGVGYLDLTHIDLPTIINELLRVGIISEAEQADARRDVAALQTEASGLRQLAVRRAYVLFRVSDVAEGGMTWIVEIDRGGKAAEAAKSLNSGRAKFLPPAGTPATGLRDFFLPKEFTAINETIVAAGTEKQLARVRELAAKGASTPREEAIAALAGLGDADVGLAVVGDTESRRVVREMFPQLPAPFMEIDGKLLADGVRWASAGMTFPPKFQLTITADAATPEIAQTLERAVGKAMVAAKALLMKESIDGPPTHQERAKSLLPLLSLVAPQVEGTRLSVAFGDDEQEIAFVRDFLPAMTQKMRDEAYRKSRMNHFKQIGLGLLNHESARKQLPAAASRDAAGRPLLSWRVQILPYLEQQQLWKEFKLDEPWDSEHNRKLIERMPDIFADPDPTVRSAIGDRGRTTFVAPIMEGAMFAGKEGIKWNDIKDGTSNTIMTVEVVPERAVVWTKPADWEVDLADALKGVKRDDREGFVAGWCDGSVRHLSNEIDPAVLKKLLTPAGREVIEAGEIK